MSEIAEGLIKAPAHGTRAHARLPLILMGVLASIIIATGWAPPAGHLNYALEVGPGVIMIATLAAVYRRFPMSHMVAICVFLHTLILIYGGIYTYAETPLGSWAKETFDLSRNHYDRVGHVALGVFPAFIAREVFLRATPLVRGGWTYFIVTSVILGVAASWELLEWWVALIVASDVGTAFLGSQGDVWDAQWDMFLAWAGAMIVLPLLGGAHDRSMAKLPRG